jgi:hypothetical protein
MNDILTGRGRTLERTRDLLLVVLSSSPGAGREGGQTNAALEQLADTFQRYASTQPTAYENGVAKSGAPGSTNLMERQIDRAMAQVLGRAPGRGAGGFLSALNGAFPVDSTGQVQFMPSRGVVSLYSPNGNGNTPNLATPTSAGLAGQISVEQANLYRQASVTGSDALSVLAGLQAFSPEAEADRVEALRALLRSDISALIDEFGRLDEPRPARVRSYLDALVGPDGHLFRFGQAAYLDRTLGRAAPATIQDESQVAGFELLQSYAATLRTIWDAYNAKKQEPVKGRPLFSERLSRASVLLPVIAEGNVNFMSAMDSIGYTENERRSVANSFVTLDPDLPDITVNDLNEWIDRFASDEGPRNLSDSGQYGLEFVTDQADTLFIVIGRVLAYVSTTPTADLNSSPVIAQALVHERVSWALNDLFNQLKALADQAA